jgi:hypothetical protein
MMTWEYLAGFIDGEGYIGLPPSPRWDKKGYIYRPTLCVYNCHGGVLEEALEFIGMGVIYTRPHNERWATAYHLLVQGRRLGSTLEQLLPHLIVKKPQAELVLEWICRSLIRQTRKIGEEEMAIISALRSLNARGPAPKQHKELSKG